ncbi:unnamed protein product, partial [marine sediment metagenome]
MSLYALIQFIIPAASIPFLVYLIVKCLINYEQKTRGKVSLYYSLSLAAIALTMGLYSIRAFLKEGQDLLAELSLGGSMILWLIAIGIYIEYWHTLYKKIPIFSKMFYVAFGGALVLVLFHPWEINYDNLWGYNQSLSDSFIFLLIIQGVCVFVIIYQALGRIKEGIDNEILYISDLVHQMIDTQKEKDIFKNKKQELIKKKKRLSYITYAFFVGIFFVLLGIIIPGPTLSFDSIGILIIFIPVEFT